MATGSDIPVNPHAVPRLSVDRLVAPSVTAGFGVSLYTRGGEWIVTQGNASASGDGERAWLVALTPRIGYFNAITNEVAMWARVATSFSSQRRKNPVTQIDAFLASFDLELSGLYRLWSNVALGTTLALALPLDGSYEARLDPAFATRMGVAANDKYQLSFTAFSLHTSLVGHF